MAQSDGGDDTVRRAQKAVVRNLETDDLRHILRRGFEDFYARPTNVLFLTVLYPVAALVLIWATFGYDLRQLVFPLVSGFALISPIAATAIFEVSRRRERGLDDRLHHVITGVLQAPSLRGLLTMGLLLAGLFLLWLWAALNVYELFFGPEPPSEMPRFLHAVLTTPEGLNLLLVGCGIGLVFAVVVFAVSVVSLPMLLDRRAGALEAIGVSLRVCRKNPRAMAEWAVIVAIGMILGTLPLFIGLAVALPVLGHATWHLYRSVVAFE